MSYILHLHGTSIEAPTAEAALELVELYAARQKARENGGRSRRTRQQAGAPSAEPRQESVERKSKSQPPLLGKLQPMQLEALQAIASAGKDGLTDEQLCAKLGLQRSSLGGVLSAISKHARALDIRFEGELIAKDPITSQAGKRGYRYLPLDGLNVLLRSVKSD